MAFDALANEVLSKEVDRLGSLYTALPKAVSQLVAAEYHRKRTELGSEPIFSRQPYPGPRLYVEAMTHALRTYGCDPLYKEPTSCDQAAVEYEEIMAIQELAQ